MSKKSVNDKLRELTEGESPERCEKTPDMFEQVQIEVSDNVSDAVKVLLSQGNPKQMAKNNKPIKRYRELIAWLAAYEEALTDHALPSWLPVEQWRHFLRERRAMGKPMTKRAEKTAINKLDRMRDKGQNIASVIKQSIDNGWSNLHEIKKSYFEKQESEVDGKLKRFGQ